MQDLRARILSARQRCRTAGGTVLDALLEEGPADLAELDGHLRNLAGVGVAIQADALEPDFSRISKDMARSLQAVALRPGQGNEAGTRLVMADPWDGDAIRVASSSLGTVPQILAGTSAQLKRLLGGADREHQMASPLGTDGSGLVVEFVGNAMKVAYEIGASDIHFECDRQGVSVKFRQDGVMAPFARLGDPAKAQEVISRIKVLAQLDITEQRTPQDGRLRFPVSASAAVDMRVSIMPSVFGEDAVLRLLDKAQLRDRSEAVSLDILGFDELSRDRIRDMAALPHGMLLVTGPTGSGKTTTVYAVLSEINTGREKIITIEDPVEYELAGVLQIPVNERKGLTFAKGLRSILRHDPDRILIGEIRDGETAEIAVQSALTGHQVFTTVHANSLFDVTGRFRHFGLDMFGFMSSLNGVVVQRLIRGLCPHCRTSRRATPKEMTWLSALSCEPGEVAAATGCGHCHGVGYKGRFVIAEVHSVDDALRDLVTTGAPVSALRRHVESSGVPSLKHRAASLVAHGATTLEEVTRVVGW